MRNNGNEFVPSIFFISKLFDTGRVNSNCLSVKFTETGNLLFKSRLLFDVLDIIPVVEFNLGLPNILRDVVVYFTTLDPLIFFYQAI
jgi:hypothetical protein